MSNRMKQIQELEEKNRRKREKKARWQASRAVAQAQPERPVKVDKKAAQKAAWADRLEKITGVKFDPKTVRPV